MILRKMYFPAVFLALFAQFGRAQESERLFDVRKLIRETLDVIRAYPPPPGLVEPLSVGLDNSGRTAQQSGPTVAQTSVLNNNYIPLDPNAAQTQHLYLLQQPLPQQYSQQQENVAYYPQQQQQPYRRIVGDSAASALYQQQLQQQQLQQMPLKQQSPGQNTARAYGSQTFNTQQPVIAAGTAQSYIPAVLAPAAAEVGPIPTPPPVARLFAAPSRQDIERLFHLPADIVHRMAADAGYVDTPQERDRYSYVSESNSESSGNSGGSGFNFNIQDNNANTVFTQTAQTSTPRPPKIIVASGTPKVVIQNAYRDGKLIQLPVLTVPQSDGHTVFMPYDRLADLSAALTKLVSSGQLSVNASAPVFHSPEALVAAINADRATASRVTNKNGASAIATVATSRSVQQNEIFGSPPNSAASRNPLFDQSSGAIATNRLPTQTFRKIFPVTDRVYPNTVVITEPNQIIAAAGTAKAAGNTAAEQQLTPMSEVPQPPPAKKIADKRDRKRVMATESNAFLQEIDEDARESSETTTLPTADASTTQKSENNDENMIILNGKRYKLVAAESAAEAESIAAKSAATAGDTGSSGQSIVDGIHKEGGFSVQNYNTNNDEPTIQTAVFQGRSQLRSAPTEIPASGRPLALAGLESAHNSAPIQVIQQKDMPSLSQPKELFGNSPVQAKYGELLGSLTQQNVGVQQDSFTQKPHVQLQQLTIQPQIYGQTSLLQQDTQLTPILQQQNQQQTNLQQEQEINYNTNQSVRPVQILATPLVHQRQTTVQTEHSSNGSAEREQVVVSSGALRKTSSSGEYISSRALPLRAAISRAASSSEVRRKEPNNKSREHSSSREQTTPFLPYQRQYSLKELEQYYRKQHTAAELTSAASDEVEQTTVAAAFSKTESNARSADLLRTAKGNSERKLKIKINSLPSKEEIPSSKTAGGIYEEQRQKSNLSESALRKLTRLEALRRQFANDRLALTRRLKSTSRASEESQASLPLPPAYCHRIRSLARQFGQLDVEYFARQNCGIVAQLDAKNLHCNAVDTYLAKCQFRNQLAVRI